MDGTLFKVEDINTIIKIFAYGIQQRFEEMQGYATQNRSDHSEQCSYFIHKYRSYKTSDPIQIKYLQKLSVRVMQIFDFFKERSKNSYLLGSAFKRIDEKLNKMIQVQPIEVGQIFSFVLDLATHGFNTKRTYSRPRRSSSKKISPLNTEQCSKQNGKQFGEFCSTQPMKKPRVVSYSANKKKRNITIQKQPLDVQINKIYGILEIDTHYLQKVMDNRQRYERESIRQNTQIMSNRKNYEKQFNKKNQKSENALKQLQNRVFLKPAVNNWVSRKRKITQCRRRRIERQNISMM